MSKRAQWTAKIRGKRAPSKYFNENKAVDGKVFQSKAEADHYNRLVLLQRAGEISGLRTQQRYACIVNSTHICDYLADFDFVSKRTGYLTIHDIKGIKTALYRLKKKLILAQYPDVVFCEIDANGGIIWTNRKDLLK